jgi:hypothetical protein
MKIAYLDWHSHWFRLKFLKENVFPPSEAGRMKVENINLHRSYSCTLNFAWLFVLSESLYEDLYVDEGYCVNLFTFQLFLFAPKRLVCNATLAREKHCRTRSCSNHVEYYSFWVVFRQRKFLPSLVLAPWCDAGFLLYDQLWKNSTCTRQFSMSVSNQNWLVFWYTLVRWAVCENSSSKALILVNHSCYFDSKLNRFYTPFMDGLLRKQLFKALILVNHFHFTTCGWATFK